MSLSTGEVTFLFTDIEGSAQLWEQDPEGMERALARHDEIIADAVRSSQGRVFKRGGDSFCCAFANAGDAAAAAASAQRALHAETWDGDVTVRVRMALHTGPAQQRAGDYFGTVINRVARLLVCAHGGQTLLSEATWGLVRSRAPAGVSFRDLGEHRLRDLSEPERIFELVHPALPADLPPLRSLLAFAHNLPVQVTSFIGREQEIEAVKRLLTETRLLTLTGAGGAGKTRLALQVAERVLEDYRDGIWFAELESLTNPTLVAQTVASSLGLREKPGSRIVETLVDHLRPRHCLLTIDNCEHVVRPCAQLVDELLRSCPDLKVLATSREGLGIAGETMHLVLSLSVPGVDDELTAERIKAFESVCLFVDRAQGHRPDFEVTESNAAALAQICRRLDGIPLAIELAAARVRAMPLEQIVQRLDDCFRLLTGGSRTALPRQQTLEALIDWSHDLLDERERTLLRRLSAFVGGWTLEAAEAVCAGGVLDEPDVLDVLTSLVTKSVTLYHATEHGARYRLLDTIRQYARERLVESGEAAAVRDRHLDFYRRFAMEAQQRWAGPEQAEWFERADLEHDNLRAALEWAEETPAGGQTGLRLARALSLFWVTRGHVSEGRQRLAAALSRAGVMPPPTRAAGLAAAGWLARHAGDYQAARAHFQEALEILRQAGRHRGVVSCLEGLGQAAFAEGEYAVARSLFEEALMRARELPSEQPVAACLLNLGSVACLQEDYDGAQGALEESLQIWRERGNERRVADCLSGLGLAALGRGDRAKAQALQAEALEIRRDLGHAEGVAESLESLAEIRLAQAQARDAARLWGAATSLREAIHVPLPPALRDEQARNVDASRAALGEQAFRAAWAEGQAMTMDEAVAYALGERRSEDV